MQKSLIAALSLIFIFAGSPLAWSQESGSESVEEKLYNFDDMLIDGAFRDPQGMFERARTEANIESVLNLKRSFMPEIEETAQETSMRP